MQNNIDDYILNKYYNNAIWFQEEVKQSNHIQRISNVLKNKEYLNGKHKILNRKDTVWKKEKYITTKLVLQEAKTIINFHNTYLLGKPISLIGSEKMVREFNKIYRKGNYHKVDFSILDKVNKYGDCFEYIYLNNIGQIASKIINSEDGYPVYNDRGEYISFIEHWTNSNSKISYYNVYYQDVVEEWNNKGGDLKLINTYNNISGLPIHHHNFNDFDELFGRSELTDIIPIIDTIEDLLSKMADAVYTLSLNPLSVMTGQMINSNAKIDADATGYLINLEGGATFDFANANMDYSTIKLLLDNLYKKLETISCIPSVALGNSNVANVSEVSLSMLYNLASMKAMLSEQWLRDSLYSRFEKIRDILESLGVEFDKDDYIDIEFNYNQPINKSELLDQLFKQYKMNAISLQTIIEKSELTKDVTQELQRIKEEESFRKDITEKNRNNDLIKDKEKVG